MKFINKIKKETDRAIKRKKRQEKRESDKEFVGAKSFVLQQAKRGERSCSILCNNKEIGEYFERNGFKVGYRDVKTGRAEGIEITIRW